MTPEPSQATVNEMKTLLSAQHSALWQVTATVASMIEPIRSAGLDTQATVITLLVNEVARLTEELRIFVDTHPEMGAPAPPLSGERVN